MRRLITDAQAKFRKMVEDQRQAVVGGASSSAGPPSASSETAAEPADSFHSPQPPPTQAGLKAALDAEKGEPPPLQTPPPPHAAASASQPPPPPPRERKVPPVPVAVTSAVENGGDQPTEVQLVRPPSPAPGPSNKQPEVAGAAASSSTSPPPSETPCTTSLLTSTSSSSASSSKQQQLSVRLENERLRREVAELRRVLSAQGGVASSVVGGANAAVGGASALGGGANGLVGGASSLVGGANGQVGGANLQEGGASALVGGASEADDGLLSDAEKVIVLESQLAQTKEALAAAKSDRKRLKAEKFDLLNQMKQLYATLEDKEKELRDFIRSFEQERCERERERWSLLRHARDEAERSLNLAAQLDIKDQQLIEARRQLSSACLSDGGGGVDGDTISLCRASLNGREGGVAPAPPTHPTTSSNLMIGGGDRGSLQCGIRAYEVLRTGSLELLAPRVAILYDSTTDGAPT
ncbi:hypothetical protein LSTR_LSTR012006 [Laodelphax striatellus]|uniref:Kazrin N-terminal domain-containing protein n=1 Tax=Laodelphax striatellus TaxID=195883 RepID=A0A482WGZ7_LAOST|nr:hypothetical protein LSTR_LSTR012006 [Laodelphax striatellus]